MSVLWPFCFHWHLGRVSILMLENTEDYSESTGRYLKMFCLGRPSAVLCQFIAKVAAVCGGGSELRRMLGP